MTYIHLFALLLVLALIAALAVYWYVSQKEEGAKPSAPKPAAKAEAKKEEPQKAPPPFPLPPELPRTVGTVKLLAQEDPEVVANICKRWLRGQIKK